MNKWHHWTLHSGLVQRWSITPSDSKTVFTNELVLACYNHMKVFFQPLNIINMNVTHPQRHLLELVHLRGTQINLINISETAWIRKRFIWKLAADVFILELVYKLSVKCEICEICYTWDTTNWWQLSKWTMCLDFFITVYELLLLILCLLDIAKSHNNISSTVIFIHTKHHKKIIIKNYY